MKKIFILFFYFALCLSLNAKTEIDKAFQGRSQGNLKKKFTLYSSDMVNNQQVREEQFFNGFGCDGENISPKLVWTNAPKNAKSFAITIFDKDAKTGSGWWHWIVYNIPANVNLIENGASNHKKIMPKGAVETINDYGTKGYGGVCPLDNEKHNYVIMIYALDVDKLDLSKKATPAMVRYYINQHKITTATINAFYGKEAKKVFNTNKIVKQPKNTKNVVVEKGGKK